MVPRDLGEAVGRASCTVARVQQHAGLHGHDGNYHRRRAAKQDGTGWWMPQARGAAAMLLTCAATFVDLIRSSDSQLDDRGRAQAVVHVGQSGRRETPRRWST